MNAIESKIKLEYPHQISLTRFRDEESVNMISCARPISVDQQSLGDIIITTTIDDPETDDLNSESPIIAEESTLEALKESADKVVTNVQFQITHLDSRSNGPIKPKHSIAGRYVHQITPSGHKN